MKQFRSSACKNLPGAQNVAAATPPGTSDELRAVAEFIGDLQRAGVDPAKPGACDELQVSPLVAAGMLGVKRQTLALWRCTRSQPLRYVKVGRRVSYRLGDLRRFIESRAQLPVQAA